MWFEKGTWSREELSWWWSECILVDKLEAWRIGRKCRWPLAVGRLPRGGGRGAHLGALLSRVAAWTNSKITDSIRKSSSDNIVIEGYEIHSVFQLSFTSGNPWSMAEIIKVDIVILQIDSPLDKELGPVTDVGVWRSICWEETTTPFQLQSAPVLPDSFRQKVLWRKTCTRWTACSCSEHSKVDSFPCKHHKCGYDERQMKDFFLEERMNAWASSKEPQNKSTEQYRICHHHDLDFQLFFFPFFKRCGFFHGVLRV